jgi:hypothetical protein
MDAWTRARARLKGWVSPSASANALNLPSRTPPHGKRVCRLVGRVLLAEAAAPEVLVERGAQIGAAFEDRVVDRRREAQLA